MPDKHRLGDRRVDLPNLRIRVQRILSFRPGASESRLRRRSRSARLDSAKERVALRQPTTRFAAVSSVVLLSVWATAAATARQSAVGPSSLQETSGGYDEIYGPTGELLWVSSDLVDATPVLSAVAIEGLRRRQASESPRGVVVVATNPSEIRYQLDSLTQSRIEPCEGANDSQCMAALAGSSDQAGSCYRAFAPGGPHPARPAVTVLREVGFQPFIDALATVAAGVVADVAVGFDSTGTPASLLTVEIENWMRRPAGTSRARTVLVVYHSNAVFEAAGVRICPARPQWAAVPAVGSRIALFGEAPVSTEAGLYLPSYGDGAQIAWETSSGMRVANETLRQAQEFRYLRFNDLLRALRRAVREGDR